MKDLKCPKCGGVMEQGLQVDETMGGAKVSTWIKGGNLPTIKVGLFPPRFEITGERYLLSTYRCESCGFVESYATEPCKKIV